MQIAFYKGEGISLRWLLDDPGAFLAHIAICVRTLSKYSHAELVIDGECYSSSARDHGVRGKVIGDLNTSGHWDIYPVKKVFDYPERALEWFKEHAGLKYDWLGIARFILPFVRQKINEYFCSEAIASALGANDAYASGLSPKELLQYIDVK